MVRLGARDIINSSPGPPEISLPEFLSQGTYGTQETWPEPLRPEPVPRLLRCLKGALFVLPFRHRCGKEGWGYLKEARRHSFFDWRSLLPLQTYLLIFYTVDGTVDYSFQVVTPDRTTTALTLGERITGDITELGEADEVVGHK